MKNLSICKRVCVCFLLSVLITPAVFAKEGQMTDDFISKLRKSLKKDIHSKAMYNAITNNDINKLALNRDVLMGHNELYSHKIDAKGITNQQKSGRCWLFAGLNVLRFPVLEKYNLEEFELSHNYLSFWDKLEKANSFLERVIEFRDRDIYDRELEIILRMPFSDGGYWESVVNLVDKYGVVPKDIMPETNSSNATGMMNVLISRKLRADAVKLRKMHQEKKPVAQLRQKKEEMVAETYRMLAMNLGEPPVEFQWRYEDANSVVSDMVTYTPMSFYKDFVGVDITEYVDVINDPSKEYGKHYQLGLSTNVYEGYDVHFANVEVQVLKDIAVKSVLDDEPVWFMCDVGKDQNVDHGIMALNMYDYDSIFTTDMYMTKADRAMYRESVPNHAMVFVGVDMQGDKPVKWLVENSWGDERGSSGYWALYDTWFDRNIYGVIVHKKYVSDKTLKILEQPTIMLPPWDPIFSIVQ